MTSSSTNNASNQVLIAGIGNIFLGDDGFGSQVARELLSLDWPDEVRVVDYGIRGVDLAYALLDGYAAVILIDAIPGNEPPGTLRVIEPAIGDLDSEQTSANLFEAHSLHPLKVLQMVKAMGGELERILIVGCQPADLGGAGGRMGLSEPVQAVVDEAVELVRRLARTRVAELFEQNRNLQAEQA